MTPSQTLASLGLTLPNVAAPIGHYVPAQVVGDLAYTSGQLPFIDGALPARGPLSGPEDVDQGAELARLAALNALAAIASVAGGLDAVKRVVSVVVYVASTPDFTQQPAVANGASDLLAAVFGEAGRHVRSAVGASSLPMDSPVEVALVCQVGGA